VHGRKKCSSVYLPRASMPQNRLPCHPPRVCPTRIRPEAAALYDDEEALENENHVAPDPNPIQC